MRRFTTFLLLSAAVSSTARAALFERDWLAPGDGLLTYDDVNQREWLDLPYTVEHFPVFSRNLEPRVIAVVKAMLPGGMLEGFTLAGREDVLALAASGGIDASAFDAATNGASASNVIQLLGETFSHAGRSAAIGFIDEFVATVPGAEARRVGGFFFVDLTSSSAGLALSESDDRLTFPLSPGVYLYRPIPEPSILALYVGGTLVLLTNRCCRLAA